MKGQQKQKSKRLGKQALLLVALVVALQVTGLSAAASTAPGGGGPVPLSFSRMIERREQGEDPDHAPPEEVEEVPPVPTVEGGSNLHLVILGVGIVALAGAVYFSAFLKS